MSLDPSLLVTTGSITTTQTKLLRQTYRVLMIAFVLFVLAALLPLNLKSVVWGHQLSTAILNVCLLPWLALALGRLGVTLQQRGQLQDRAESTDITVWSRASSAAVDTGMEDDEDSQQDGDENPYDDGEELASDGDFRFLARLGFYALLLLAVWQVVLFGVSLRQIDTRQVNESLAIDQRFEAVEQQLKRLPAANLPQALQQLGLDAAPAGQSKNPFERLDNGRVQVKKRASRNANQARFVLSRESLRNFLLAVLYATGFYGLARI